MPCLPYGSPKCKKHPDIASAIWAALLYYQYYVLLLTQFTKKWNGCKEGRCLFGAGRRMEILLEGYEVPGITARYAIQNKLIYNKEGMCYDEACIS